MKQNSIRVRILLIFTIPIIALLYFSFFSVISNYKKLEDTQLIKESGQLNQIIANLIKNIQIERGLSSGYIVANDKTNYKESLLLQHRESDFAYKQFLQTFDSSSIEKSRLYTYTELKTQPLIKDILNAFNNLNIIRESVLNSSISFNDEIKYYTQINKKLIFVMEVLNNSIYDKFNIDTVAIAKLEIIKENAGLERAYIYNQLVSGLQEKELNNIKKFQSDQDDIIENFLINASEISVNIYNKNFSNKIKHNLEFCRNGVMDGSLSEKNAIECFNISTKYIDMFNDISKLIFSNYLENTKNIYEDANNSLYITTLLWVTSLISLMLLFFLFRKYLIKEEKNTDKLRIASYAFDAQEAMAITDTHSIIIKVNKSFTQITGYSANEVIGEKISILKSDRYDMKFFDNMWSTLVASGKWNGEIYNKRKNGEIYPERLSITAIKNDNNETTHYIAQFLDISDIIEAKKIAEYQADHDFLTNILNRKSLMQRLNEEFAKASRHNFIHAFLFIDLDSFKSVNDNYGHNVGDTLIIEISKRLKKVIRQGDILARMSGDEFAIILLNLHQEKNTAAKAVNLICKKILKVINKELIVEKNSIQISASIGIKLFPENEKDIQEIITHADTAMYRAKHQGKNQFVFFDKEIERKLLEFSTLDKEIRKGLKNSQFEMFYQPKVQTNSGKIDGAELLIRWNHPTKGLLFPDYFIEVANKTDSIYEFTNLALISACNFINSNKNFHGSLAVNISSKELLYSNFEDKVIDIISKSKVNPAQIEIEITENDLIGNFDLAVKKIEILQKFGLKFSIDDFGTGYSSITYLQKLPVNSIKIDRSFIMNLSNESNKELVKMMINIGKTFNMQVITEGIEDESQLKFIKECGSELYQGYYFSKAVQENKFIEMLMLP